MRRFSLALSLVALSLTWGCQPEQTGPPDATDAGSSDLRDDISDSSETDGADAGCSQQSDCSDEEICVESTCRKAPSCSGPEDWDGCVEAVNEMKQGLGPRAYCDGSRCRLGCMLDRDCPEGQICTDFGSCETFEGSLEAPSPGGSSREKLRAGVGQELMQFPIGLSLGGYGSRMKADAGRYVKSLRRTHGQMHGLFARAIALDNGRRKLVMVRLPIIFSTSALHEAVARRLQKETGKNWRGSLLISSTHTHSGPARFYQLPSPEETFIPLGRLGVDEFHDQVFRWLVEDTASAAREAIDDLQPAQLGTTVVEGFDNEDVISRDRRDQTPDFDDNRLLILRVDDTSGTPLAVAVSFGTHGTIHSEDYFNGDSLGGVEQGLERALADEYGRFVPVLYFNQKGGSMSPGGDGRGHDGPQRFEKLGHEFAEIALDDVTDVQTRRSVALDGTTYRFPITYELVGYSQGEFGSTALDTTGESFHHGAFRCLGDGDGDFGQFTKPEDLDCVSLHRLLFHRPPTLFLRSQISAFRVGEMTFFTSPGELTMELGWRMQRRLKNEFGLDPAKTWAFGFAQDHQFYLLPDRLEERAVSFPGFEGMSPKNAPERAFSYLQGGYEANMSFWGWKFGDFLVDRTVDAVERLRKEEVERRLPETLPTQYSSYGQSDFPIEESDPGKVGNAVDEPPKTVERFQAVEYAWIGGDPGAERPQSPRVALQRQSQGSFETLETDSLQPYTNREPVMLTRLRKKNNSWVWVVRWEEGRDLPSGTYRFAVEGEYLGGSGTKSYTTHSREFDVEPSDDLAVTASVSSGTITGTVGYPAGEELSYDAPSEDPGAVSGNFRLRDPRVPTGLTAPLEVGAELQAKDVEITFSNNGSTVATSSGSEITLKNVERTRGGTQAVPTTSYSASVPSSLSSGTNYKVEVRVEDAHGNIGTTTFNHQPGS